MTFDDDLRSADPAAGGTDPDIAALRAKVDARLAQEEQALVSGHVVELKGRRSWWIAGTAAAGVALLAVGTLGGVVFSNNNDGGLIAGVTDTPAELPAVNSNPMMDAMTNPMAGPNPGGAGGAAVAMSGDEARLGIWPGFGIDLEPTADLIDEPGVADGYRLNGADVDKKALATTLAEIFGVSGAPEDQDGAIVVGGNSGESPQIWVSTDTQVNWSFSDPTRDPWACGVESTPAEDPGGMTEPGIDCADPAGEPMSEAAARDEAEQILASVGITDTQSEGVGIDWETSTDGVVTTATAWQTLNGQRTQLSWYVSFDAEGPLWANGFAAGLEIVPDFPIVGARSAVIRSEIPRWSAFGPTPFDSGVMPMLDDAVARDNVAANEVAPLPVAPSGSRSVPVLWDPAIATSAELTLAQYWAPDGSFFLLPAYRLQTADDRGEWTIIAVAESAVTFSTSP